MIYGICPELKIESLLAFSLTRKILVGRESVPAQIDLLVKAGVMSSVLGYSWITPSTAVRELFKLFFCSFSAENESLISEQCKKLSGLPVGIVKLKGYFQNTYISSCEHQKQLNLYHCTGEGCLGWKRLCIFQDVERIVILREDPFKNSL